MKRVTKWYWNMKPSEQKESISTQNMLLHCIGYFELKAFEKQHIWEGFLAFPISSEGRI